MKLKEIINETIKIEEPVSSILKKLYEENLSLDLDSEDLETTLEQEITTEMIEKIKTLTMTKANKWDYFDVMKILGF